MLSRIRSIWLAGGGAVALAVALSGVVAAATVVTALVSPTSDPTVAVVDTTATFEDLDGNGVDDDCQTEVVANPEAAASAELAADLDGDGTISVSEAAQSGRTGGKNCNHGGYVSTVAHGDCATHESTDTDTTEGTTEDEDADADEAKADAPEADSDEAVAATCETDEETAPTDEETKAECETVEPVAPAEEPLASVALVPEDLSPNAHGKAVSDVARSDAVGDKNCNHGGAVSEAAKKDQDAAREARNAAKVAREAAREARKAAREAKHHGKPD